MTGTPLPEDTDLKAFLARYLRAWPILVVAGVALLALVVAILMTVQPTYGGSTSIVINTPMRHDDPNRLVQLPSPVPRTDKNYYYNEQLRITSQPVIRNVVDRLGLRTTYVQEGSLLDWDVYRESPIQVELDNSSVRDEVHVPYSVPFYLHDVSGDGFLLVGEGKYGPADRSIEISQPAQFGEWITLDSMRVRIIRAAGSKLPLEGDDAATYGFVQHDPEHMTLELMGSVLGEMSLAEATTVKVTYAAAPKAKVLDILQAIGEEYTNTHLEEQRRDLDMTIAMVQKEITGNAAQLTTTSDQLERFKAAARITNLAHSTVMLQETMKALDDRREELMVQADYYTNLLGLLEKGDAAKLPSPKAYGVSDPLLNDMTTAYASLQSDIEVMREEEKTANPAFNRMSRLLQQQQANIRNTVESFKRNNRISLDNIDTQRMAILARQDSVPRLDRNLADRERDQRVHEAVNTDLMSRLSNLHVQRAALAPEVSITTPAYLTDEDPSFPNAVVLLAIAFLLALMAPLGFIVLRALFSDKITSLSDLAKALPGVPFAAPVPFSTHRDPAGFVKATASAAYVEMAKIASHMEQQRTGPTELHVVCGAGGKESTGTFVTRLAWLLAQRGNPVVLVRSGEATPPANLRATLTLLEAGSASLGSIKDHAAQHGQGFILVETRDADALAITPDLSEVDRAIVVCQPGRTTRSDLRKLSFSRSNGQLPPMLLVLDNVKDKALPWYGLAGSRGERRLGPGLLIAYHWSRAQS